MDPRAGGAVKDLFANPARVLAGCVILAVLTFAAWLWLSGALTSGARAKVEARLQSSQLDAAAASASDAVDTIASQAASEAEIDAITLENDRAIRSASGAAAPVDPAVAGAGLRGLCRRPAYLRSEQCLRFTPAR